MSATIPSLPSGHIINEYRFDKLLGVGGFGYTYLATDLNLNLPVAIKEYLPSNIACRADDLSVKPTKEESRPTFNWGLTRFLDEARTLAAFHHPNIVRVMRYFQAHETAYMVMEFVDGASLTDWIQRRRPLPQSNMVRLIQALTEGLGVIHRSNYLHRDIKPCNIYIRKDLSPVLLDFGAARSTATDKGHTAIVSLGYAPIEQYSESSLQGPWTDLYAIGGVVYWLLTGKRPIEATARLRNDPQIPALEAGDRSVYTPEFLAIIDWMLMMEEHQRPQSCEELLARLAALPVDAFDTDPTQVFAEGGNPDPRHHDPGRRPPPILRPTSGLVEASQLKDLESALARHLGPFAAVLVKKAAKKHTTFSALLEAVAAEIEDEAERSGFIKKMRGNTQPPSSPASEGTAVEAGHSSGSRPVDSASLTRVESLLAHHIGVVAHVVVKRAALKAHDESELFLLVADKIENPDDRQAFLKTANDSSGRRDHQSAKPH